MARKTQAFRRLECEWRPAGGGLVAAANGGGEGRIRPPVCRSASSGRLGASRQAGRSAGRSPDSTPSRVASPAAILMGLR